MNRESEISSLEALSPDKTVLVVLGGRNQKMRVLAAIEYCKVHSEVEFIVFTGGKTNGPYNPSEAQEMDKYFREKYPDSQVQIILEEEAINTEDNARRTTEKLQAVFNESVREILLLTDSLHLGRSGWGFTRRGFKIRRISSEYWMGKRSDHHKKYVVKLIFSREFLIQSGREFLAHIGTVLPKGRAIMDWKSRKVIGNK